MNFSLSNLRLKNNSFNFNRKYTTRNTLHAKTEGRLMIIMKYLHAYYYMVSPCYLNYYMAFINKNLSLVIHSLLQTFQNSNLFYICNRSLEFWWIHKTKAKLLLLFSIKYAYVHLLKFLTIACWLDLTCIKCRKHFTSFVSLFLLFSAKSTCVTWLCFRYISCLKQIFALLFIPLL